MKICLLYDGYVPVTAAELGTPQSTFATPNGVSSSLILRAYEVA